MVEIAAALSMASSAYGAIKQAIETGREAQDVVQVFSRFFDAKEELAEANVRAETSSFIGKIFSGSSVEAQALEATAARYKMMAMEKELREFLIYTGQSNFYEDMMKERREIRLRRAQAAKAAAERKAFWIDVLAIGIGMAVSIAIIIGFIKIIS